jgi:hypothetical protein
MAKSVTTHFCEIEIPIYLVSNQKSFRYPGVVNIKTGLDIDWSSSCLTALEQIPEDFLLIFLDDMPLIAKPDSEILKHSFGLLENNIMDTLQPRSVRRVRKYHKQHIYWYEYHEQEPYTANVFAFWRKSILFKAIERGETAWDFEIYGSARLNKYGKSGALRNELFKYEHLVEKGVWVNSINSIVQTNNFVLDLSIRNISHSNVYIESFKKIVFNWILNYLPPRVQSRLIKNVHKFRTSQ